MRSEYIKINLHIFGIFLYPESNRELEYRLSDKGGSKFPGMNEKMIYAKPNEACRKYGLPYRLQKMFGYSTALRSATQGRATFTMQFSRFDRA